MNVNVTIQLCSFPPPLCSSLKNCFLELSRWMKDGKTQRILGWQPYIEGIRNQDSDKINVEFVQDYWPL